MRFRKVLVLTLAFYVSYSSTSANALEGKIQAKEGEEFVVSINLSQNEDDIEGVNVYAMKIDYDKSIFEPLSKSSFKSLGTWNDVVYNPKNGKFTSVNAPGAKSSDDVVEVTFKVKEGSKAQKTDIKVSDILVSANKEEISYKDQNLTVDVIQKGLLEGDTINPSKNNDETVNEQKKNVLDTKDIIGMSSIALLIVAEGIIIILIRKGSIKYSFISTNKKKCILLLNLLIALEVGAFVIIATKTSDNVKNLDTNSYESNYKDDSITNSKVEEMQKALIQLESKAINKLDKDTSIDKTPEKPNDGTTEKPGNTVPEKPNDGTTEKPGNTVPEKPNNGTTEKPGDEAPDTPPSIGDIEDEIDKEYEDKVNKTNIVDIKYDYYHKKDSKLELLFTIDQDVVVDKVTIDNVEYPVEMVEGKKFKVQLTSAKESGIQEFNISELKISSKYKKDVDKSIQIDVLKEKPQVEIGSYKEEASSDNTSTNISFNLIDSDNAITNSYINIKDSKGKIYKTIKAKAGENNISIPLEVDEKYSADIIADYDLDTNKLNEITGSQNEVKEEVLLEKPIQLVRDYNFSASGIRVERENGIYGREDKIKVYINSSNESEFEPEYAKINGRYYTLTKVDSTYESSNNKNNTYVAEIEGYDTIGEKSIEVEEILLKNGKSFTVKEHVPQEESNTVEIEIMKKKPFVSKLTTEEDEEKSTLQVNVDITDEDNVLLKRSVILKDSQGNILDSKELSANKEDVTFNTKLTSKYIVQVVADYDISHNDTNNIINNDVIYEEEIVAKDKVNISDSGVSSYYLEKNSEVYAYYSFETNTTDKISKITINNIELDLKKNEDKSIPYEYFVKLPLSDASGIVELKATKVTFDNGREFNVSNNQNIEVLKDVLTLKDYSVVSDINNNTVTVKFNIEDKDNSFVSGKAILGSNEKVINAGKNELTFNINPGDVLDFKVLATYDRDTNAINDITGEQNLVTDKEIFTESVQLVEDYDLNISELKSFNGSKESKYFEKNEAIKLAFKSTNNSNFIPKKVKINQTEYEVQESNGTYYTTIDGLSKSGQKKFKVEQITLSNGKVLDINTDNEIEVEILKDAPKLNNYSVSSDINTNSVTVQFDIEDNDNSFISGKATLGTNEESIYVGTNKLTFKVNPGETLDFKVLVTYDGDTNIANDAEGKLNRVEDYEIRKESIQLVEDYDLKISELKTLSGNNESKYFEKNEDIKLSFKSTNKSKFTPNKVTVNKTEYAVEEDNGVYYVTLNGLAKAGENKFKIEQVTLNNGKVLEVTNNNEIDVEVLKDAPELKNYSVSSDINTDTVKVQFDIEDNDKSFISGEAILGTKKQAISAGNNELTFKVIPGQEYNFKVLATYDRDTNRTDDAVGQENLVTNKEIFTKALQLVEDYNLKISEIKTFKGDNESKYFEKNEEIKLAFKSTNNSKFIPKKVRINQNEYEVQESSGTYYVTLSGLPQAGHQKLTVEQITLSNDKVLEVNEGNEGEIEVLKSKPTVTDFNVDEGTKGKMKISFNLVDDENTLDKATLVIENKNQKKLKKVKLSNSIFRRNKVVVGENKFEFNVDGSEEYFVHLTADYDLDTDVFGKGDNEYTETDLLNEVITVKSRLVELKDISSIDLYRRGADGNTEEITKVDLSQTLNLDDYLVKVNMKNSPSVYTKIKNYEVINDELVFTLDYKNGIQYDGSKGQEDIKVVYASVHNNIAANMTFEELVEAINNNPSGKFTLYKDYDASVIKTGNVIIPNTFTGTLDGNGHTISGLDRPLFQQLNGEVKNLKIVDSSIRFSNGDNTSSLLANITNGATVKNILVDNINIVGRRFVSGFVGVDKKGSTFDNITIRNAKVLGSWTNVGVFLSEAVDSKISNISIINSTAQIPKDYYFTGGFIGLANNAKINNVVADINIGGTTPSNASNAGFIGKAVNSTIENAITLGNSLETLYKFVGKDSLTVQTISNSYEKESSIGVKNTTTTGISQASDEQLNTEEFYKDTLKLDKTIWDFSTVKSKGHPVLKYAVELEKEEEFLSTLNGYDPNRVQIYENMKKIMPFTDSEYIVIDGNKIPESHVFNQKEIKTVFPVNSNGKRVIALTDKNYSDVSKIKVLFDDDSVEEYSIKVKNLTNNIARYNISDLNVEYNFNKYIQNEESPIIKELAAKIKGFDYDTDILTRPTGTDDIPRLFRDHYNQSIKDRAEEIAIALVANNSEYASYSDDAVLYNLIKKELIDNDYLKDFMYVFTYVDRWYDFEIGGINLRDIVLFDNTIFKEKQNTKAVVKEIISNTNANDRKGNNTPAVYRNRFAQFTGKTHIDELIEYLITTFAGEKYKDDVNDWILDNFQGGVIYESLGEFEGGENLDQRLWSYLKQNMAIPRGQALLPILSYKGKDLYLFSVPTQIAFGNMNLYSEYKQDDASRVVMKEKITKIADSLTTFYENTSKIVKDPISALNALRQIQVDSSRMGGKVLDFNTTEDSVYKNIYLPMYWRDKGNNTAVANSASWVFWNNGHLLDSNSLSVFTHETAHNQDNRLFFENNAQRRDPWTGEDFTNGFITQNFANGEYNMNLSKEWAPDSNITTNLTPDRITSPEKIKDFYSKVFDTLDIMDYLQGQAFLKLTPSQQSKIAQKHVYKNGSRRDSYWRNMNAKEIENMNLDSIEDLYDNEINIIPNRNNTNVVNSYTPDYIYYTHWYQPYNDAGKPNPVIMKRNYWYLLSKYGYSDGLVKYATKVNGKEMGDLDRMKLITGNPNFTWRDFALDRFDGIEEKINKSTYFDKEEIINEFYTAFVDSANDPNNLNQNPWGNPSNYRSMDARLRVYRYLQRITDDFRGSIYSETANKVNITSGEQFIEEVSKNPNGYFVLENDIELRDVENSEVIIDKTFVGKIEGNGHTIYGMTKPIFRNVRHSYISELALKTDINGTSNKTLLGKSVASTIIAEDKTYQANISSINDLKSINLRPNGTYTLTKDIDASSITDGPIIASDFKGKIDGNGYTITGLKVPLFKHVAGTVENLKIKDATIEKGSDDYANAFSQTSEGATINNIELYNVNVSGNDYVTPFIGSDKNSTINKVAIKNSIVSNNGTYGSGFIGKTEGTTIENVVVGEVNMTLGNQFSAGFIGEALNTTSRNNYVSAYIEESSTMNKDNTAGFVGKSTGSTFENVIVGSYVPDNINIVMPTESEVLSSIKNGYELDTLSGISNITSNTGSVLKETSLDKVGQSSFLTGEAGFDSNIWEINRVSELLYPEINNLKTYSKPGVLKILSLKGLKKISKDLTGTYQLGKDIDASSHTSGIVIPGTFKGTLEGNGFTIKGLKNTLFENLQGRVENLKIKDADISNLNVLAKQTSNANVRNVHFENIKLSGGKYTGTVSGKDTGSTFSNISLKSVDVEAKDQYSGGFIGETTNSNISNILILESKIKIFKSNTGGFIGKVNKSIIDKVFSDVDSNFDNYSMSVSASKSSGFIGDINTTPSSVSNITNCIAVGNSSNPQIYKFIGNYSSYAANNQGSNNFELRESTGGTTNSRLVTAIGRSELETEDFYRTRVTFDESIWDLSTVVSNGYPTLKSMN